MSEVQLPQGQQKQGLLGTAMMGLQAYGAVKGIQKDNAEIAAMKRKMDLMQNQTPQANADSGD